MTALNAVLPAILAGNTVVMKHSSQTALVAEHFADCFAKANLPKDVFQVLHMSHEATERAIRSGLVDQVGFTGSTAGGRAIMAAVAAAPNFPATCLELGGKDPAYVRADANLAFAIENVVDGGYFNSGQSCCAVERIYVHEAVYDKFVEGAVATDQRLQARRSDRRARRRSARWSAPGPPISSASQVAKAMRQGARPLIDAKRFAADKPGTPYLAPQLLVDVDHSMEIMTEETFGPAHGIMKVKSDEEAIRLMNNSPFGLTASIWTEDVDAAERIGDRIETGTCLHEPRRLPRPGARLGRRQGIRPRRHALQGRLRAPDPAEELPPPDEDAAEPALPARVLQPGETVVYATRLSWTNYHSGPALLIAAIVV